MGPKTRVVLTMAVVTTMAAERRAYAEDARDPTLSTDVSVTVRLDNNAGVPDEIRGIRPFTEAEARAIRQPLANRDR